MSYTPTTWNTGDTVTASAMNKIENGIANAGSVLIVTSSIVNSVQTMDKTLQEIYNALSAGTPVYLSYIYGDPAGSASIDYTATLQLCPIIEVYRYSSGVFRVNAMRLIGDYVATRPQIVMFNADTMSSYPTFYKTCTVNPNSMQ